MVEVEVTDYILCGRVAGVVHWAGNVDAGVGAASVEAHLFQPTVDLLLNTLVNICNI